MLCLWFIKFPFVVSFNAKVRINIYKGLKLVWNQKTKHSIHQLLNKRTIKDIVDKFFYWHLIEYQYCDNKGYGLFFVFNQMDFVANSVYTISLTNVDFYISKTELD